MEHLKILEFYKVFFTIVASEENPSILERVLLAMRSFIAARRVAAVDTDARDRRITDAIASYHAAPHCIVRDGRDSRSFIT